MNNNQFVPVNSSIIESVAFSNKEKKMWVKFKKNTMYVYEDVDIQTYMNFLISESKGSYLNKVIKNNHNYKKLKE